MPYGYTKCINNHKRPNNLLQFIEGIDFFTLFELKPIRTKMLVSCIEDITTILRKKWVQRTKDFNKPPAYINYLSLHY